MIIQLRKYDFNGPVYTLAAKDNRGICHVLKSIDKNEFERVFDFYNEAGFEIESEDDQGQSEELYKIIIPD